MKKWIIIGVIIAVVVIASVGGVGYVVLRRASSKPDVVVSIEQVPGAEGAWHATWSPDGQRILYESSGIWTADADGMNGEYLGEGSCPSWSADGSQIAFATDNGLQVMNADGGERRLLIDLAKIAPPLSRDKCVDSTAWSPRWEYDSL